MLSNIMTTSLSKKFATNGFPYSSRIRCNPASNSSLVTIHSCFLAYLLPTLPRFSAGHGDAPCEGQAAIAAAWQQGTDAPTLSVSQLSNPFPAVSMALPPPAGDMVPCFPVLSQSLLAASIV